MRNIPYTQVEQHKAATNDADSMPVVEMLRGGVEIIDKLADEWRKLCEEGPCNEPFHRPEFIAAYVRAFARETTIVVLIVRMDGRLKAVLPLSEERKRLFGLPISTLRTLTEPHWWRTDVVRGCGGKGDAAVLALWNFLKTYKNWDILEMRLIPGDGDAEALFQAASSDGFNIKRVEYQLSPYITLSRLVGKEEPFAAASSANFRRTLKQTLRKVKKQGGLVLERYTKADPELLQRFYDIEHSCWKGMRGMTAINNPSHRMFCDEIALAAERFGYLTLYFLKLNEHTVASHFGFTCGRRYFLFRIAVDQQYSAYSPGHLSVNAVLADCFERGLEELDFIGANDEWKLKWTDELRAHDFCYVFRGGLYGYILHAIRFPQNTVLKKILQTVRLILKPNSARQDKGLTTTEDGNCSV